jgi:hypothetical protein
MVVLRVRAHKRTSTAVGIDDTDRRSAPAPARRSPPAGARSPPPASRRFEGHSTSADPESTQTIAVSGIPIPD